VVNEVLKNCQNLYGTTAVKNMDRAIVLVEAIDKSRKKSILETKYGNGKRLSTKMLRCAKTKQRFSGVIWEMQLPQLLLMNGDTRNTKPIYSIRQMPLKIPK
jgi:hypothetical protein